MHVRRGEVHLEFYQRDVTHGMLSPWKLPVDVVSKGFREVVKVAQKLETAVQPFIICMENVDYDALLRALLNEVRLRGAHALNCSVTERGGYSERRISPTRSIQHVYVRDESGRLFIEVSLIVFL